MAAAAVLRYHFSKFDHDFYEVVYAWWYNFEQILHNIGASPKIVFYVSRQLLPQSFFAVFDWWKSVTIRKSYGILKYCFSFDAPGQLVELMVQNNPYLSEEATFFKFFNAVILTLWATRKSKKLNIDQKCHKVPFHMFWLICRLSGMGGLKILVITDWKKVRWMLTAPIVVTSDTFSHIMI